MSTLANNSTYSSGSEGQLPLAFCLSVDEVPETFHLCKIKTTAFKSASGEFPALSGTTEWEERDGIEH